MGGRKRERERERERETSMCGCLPCAPYWPATQVCALTGNQTGDALVKASTQSTEQHHPGLISCHS